MKKFMLFNPDGTPYLEIGEKKPYQYYSLSFAVRQAVKTNTVVVITETLERKHYWKSYEAYLSLQIQAILFAAIIYMGFAWGSKDLRFLIFFAALVTKLSLEHEFEKKIILWK